MLLLIMVACKRQNQIFRGLGSRYYNIGSLELAVVGLFTMQKLANAVSQGFLCSSEAPVY